MGGALVRVLETEANGDPLLRPRVILEDGPHLGETITRHCGLLKLKGKPGKPPERVHVDCPRAVTDTLNKEYIPMSRST